MLKIYPTFSYIQSNISTKVQRLTLEFILQDHHDIIPRYVCVHGIILFVENSVVYHRHTIFKRVSTCSFLTFLLSLLINLTSPLTYTFTNITDEKKDTFRWVDRLQ